MSKRNSRHDGDALHTSAGHEAAFACQGDLADQMFDALYALHRSRRERFTDRHDEIANAWESATRLVEVYEGLRQLRRCVMAGDTLLNEDATED